MMNARSARGFAGALSIMLLTGVLTVGIGGIGPGHAAHPQRTTTQMAPCDTRST